MGSDAGHCGWQHSRKALREEDQHDVFSWEQSQKSTAWHVSEKKKEEEEDKEGEGGANQQLEQQLQPSQSIRALESQGRPLAMETFVVAERHFGDFAIDNGFGREVRCRSLDTGLARLKVVVVWGAVNATNSSPQKG